MEIDISHMVEDSDEMPLLSGSIAELGTNAGRLTWANSIAYGLERPLLETDEQRDAARDHFAEYGAWERAEIDAWSEVELQAIMCQEVAGALRELECAEDYEDYVAGCEAGTYSGRISRGDDGRWYFYLGL